MTDSTPVEIEIASYQLIDRLNNGWKDDDYRNILFLLEIDEAQEIEGTDLLDMVHMALTDQSKADAAELLIKAVIGTKLKPGQITEAAHEMIDEKLWEEHADLSLHESFFNIGQLLFDAFGGGYPKPRAASVVMNLVGTGKEGAGFRNAMCEENLVCALAREFPPASRLQRMFSEQLKKNAFPEAASILWTFDVSQEEATGVEVNIVGSQYWLSPLGECQRIDTEIRF